MPWFCDAEAVLCLKFLHSSPKPYISSPFQIHNFDFYPEASHHESATQIRSLSINLSSFGNNICGRELAQFVKPRQSIVSQFTQKFSWLNQLTWALACNCINHIIYIYLYVPTYFKYVFSSISNKSHVKYIKKISFRAFLVFWLFTTRWEWVDEILQEFSSDNYERVWLKINRMQWGQYAAGHCLRHQTYDAQPFHPNRK